MMRIKLTMLTISLFIITSAYLAKPSFNGTNPGCSGGNCHTLQDGIVSANILNNLQIEITLTGVTPNRAVAGELVDINGNVVDFNDGTTDNPFILTAPEIGLYRVNAGYKNPNRSWDSTLVELTTTNLDIPTPANTRSTFGLYPNHPNPFNTETMIRFSLTKNANVEIEIFNINGQHIRSLAQGRYAAGIHTLRWDGRDDRETLVSSGIYLCQIKSGDNRIVRRMILSK
jgi:hypothetical protein